MEWLCTPPQQALNNHLNKTTMPPEQQGRDNYATSNAAVTQGMVEAPRPYDAERLAPFAGVQPEQPSMRPLAIRQLNHGYIIEVGCQTFAIESASNLIAKLSEYILNPTATEQKWREGKLF